MAIWVENAFLALLEAELLVDYASGWRDVACGILARHLWGTFQGPEFTLMEDDSRKHPTLDEMHGLGLLGACIMRWVLKTDRLESKLSELSIHLRWTANNLHGILQMRTWRPNCFCQLFHRSSG